MSNKTPGGVEFDYWKPDEMPEHPLFVVLHISGAYSGISWRVAAITESLDDAQAWMDARPLRSSQSWPEGYEVSVSELTTSRVAP